MKRYVISTGFVLIALLTAWAAFGQPGERPVPDRGRGRDKYMMFLMLSPEEATELRKKWPDMSEEERNKYRSEMRAKWDSLSDEEKEKLRSQMPERYGRSMVFDSQLNAIRAIETQLKKLKANFQGMRPESGRSYRDLSEEERTGITEQFAKTRGGRQGAFQEILAQLVRLQGQKQTRSSTRNTKYIIVNISDLKTIQDSAEKEKVKATKERILTCCQVGNYLNAGIVVFHPGFYGKEKNEVNKKKTYDKIKEGILDMQNTIKKNKWDVEIAPETMGKVNVFGSIEEISRLVNETKCSFCKEYPWLFSDL